LDFKCLYFLEKYSMIFQNSLIKYIIHKIKKHKNFYNLLTKTNRRNWKDTHRLKKQIVNRRILKKKYFTYLYFFKRNFTNFQESLIKSLTLPLKHYKKFHNFWTSLDRWNRKKMPKMLKKNKKEIINDDILLKFWISSISILFEKKKTILLHKFLIKSRIHTINNTKILRIFWKPYTGKIEKKDVKNTKKLKKQIVKDGILKKFCIQSISIFFNKNSRIFQNSLIKSIICTIKHHKNV